MHIALRHIRETPTTGNVGPLSHVVPGTYIRRCHRVPVRYLVPCTGTGTAPVD